MNYYTLEEFKAKLLAGLDIIEFLDAADISLAEVINRFEDVIEEKYEELVDALGEKPFL